MKSLLSNGIFWPTDINDERVVDLCNYSDDRSITVSVDSIKGEAIGKLSN